MNVSFPAGATTQAASPDVTPSVSPTDPYSTPVPLPDNGAVAAPLVNVEISEENIERRYDTAFINSIKIPRDEILRTHGHSDPTFYERLRRDPQVQATFQRRRLSVVAKAWKVEPGGDADIDKAAAVDLEAQLNALPWDRITFRMLGGMWPGYGVGECMFALGPDGLIDLCGVKVRRSGRFRFTQGGDLLMITSTTPFGVPLPPRKMWVFCCGADDDDEPYGLGLAHYCYWPIWFQRQSIRFWALFLERFSLPLPHGSVPPGTPKVIQQELEEALKAFVAGGALVTTSNVDVNLIQTAKDSGGDFERFINLCQADIAKIILTQTMTTDDGSSQSQAEVHMSGEEVVVKSDADLICESFMAGPAKWLTEWNFPGAKTPRVWRDFSESENLDARADRDSKLSTAGWHMTPEAFEDVYGEGYVYTAPAPAASPDGGGGGGAVPATYSELASQREKSRLAYGAVKRLEDAERTLSSAVTEYFAAERRRATLDPLIASALSKPANFDETAVGSIADAVERLVANDGWRRVLGPQVEALGDMIGDASSLPDVRDRLGAIALTDPSALTDALSRVLFAARISGEAGDG